MKSQQQLLVSSKSLPGREEEYVSWYLNEHIADVLAVPGFNSGQFFRSLDASGKDLGEFKAVYQVEAEEPSVLIGAFMGRIGEMHVSAAIDPASVTFTFLVPA